MTSTIHDSDRGKESAVRKTSKQMARMVSEWARAIAALFVRLPQEEGGDKRGGRMCRLSFMRVQALASSILPALPSLVLDLAEEAWSAASISKMNQTALRQDVKPWLGARSTPLGNRT